MCNQSYFPIAPLAVLLLFSLLLPFSSSATTFICTESNTLALLQFKNTLNDPYDRLASWIPDEDCCKWSGIACDNHTGHVIKLNLRNNDVYLDGDYIPRGKGMLRGMLNPSLAELKHLEYLDLSFNDFRGSLFPSFIGIFQELLYLNLSHANLGGFIPHSLGNLSKLLFLDLSASSELSTPELNLGTEVMWLSRLNSLRYLDMSTTIFPEGISWLQALNKLPSISTILLQSCRLDSIDTDVPYLNFTSLSTLDLSDNSFTTTLPTWLFNISSMQRLLLSESGFFDSIPHMLGGTKTSNYMGLKELDLSDNDLDSVLPPWLFNSSLRRLNLNSNGFSDISCDFVGPKFGTFMSLEVLDLSHNQFNSTIPPCLFNITSLRYLDLSDNEFTTRGGSPNAIGGMTSMEVLKLDSLQLQGNIREFTHSLCKIEELRLSKNQITGSMNEAFTHCDKPSMQIVFLSLEDNKLTGSIPRWLGDIKSIVNVIVSRNYLNGPIPSTMGKLQNLMRLDLSNNNISGDIPESIWMLQSLNTLDLSGNSLNGNVSLVNLSGLVRMSSLHLSSNYLKLSFPSDWRPQFQLKELGLGSCALGAQFPIWIQDQVGLSYLNLSNTGISDTLPQWIWNFSSSIVTMDLSNNNLTGSVPNLINVSTIAVIDIRLNNLNSMMPLISGNTNLNVLIFSNNQFYGPIQFVNLPSLKVLSISSNNVSTMLPVSVCKLNSLHILDISENYLYGVLPECLGSLKNLETLHLNDNKFTGSLPKSLKNCSNLSVLDVGSNMFTGVFPRWIVRKMANLKILSVRSNMFSRYIPSDMSSNLSMLQVLDLADNNFSGPIPQGFGNLSAMMIKHLNNNTLRRYETKCYQEKIIFFFRKQKIAYDRLLILFSSLDISGNSLSGEIPSELGNLLGLMNMNLSRNNLIGGIPLSLGRLQQLESLDLSWNNLSGSIPKSISELSSLSHFNISYNNISGEIPVSRQFDTFSNWSFVGNPRLCGTPLEPCNVHMNEGFIKEREDPTDEDPYDIFFVYLGMPFGFVIGIWLLWGTLIVTKGWWSTYFQFIENSKKLCMFV